MPDLKEKIDHDLAYLNGHQYLLGIDEAGRGPLAGPVVGAAVLADAAFLDGVFSQPDAAMVMDSKQLSARKRECALALIHEWRQLGKLEFCIYGATVKEIDHSNILLATIRCMQDAASHLLNLCPGHAENRSQDNAVILLDGTAQKQFPFPHASIIKGDDISFLIGAASILAKTYRDTLMGEIHRKYPHYGFDRHKGYGTQKHREALREHGPCPEHRPRFIRKLFPEK